MTFLFENIHLALPEMVLTSAAVLALLGDLFLKRCCKNAAFIISMLGLGLCILLNALMLGEEKHIIFSGLYISDGMGGLMKVFICFTVLLCFFYSRNYLEERQIPSGDYYVLGLFSTLGMMILVSAHSLLTIYLGLELLSLPLYAMTAIRRTHADASEAAIKYFIMGAVASGMLLYGFSLLYAATGKLDLSGIANAITVVKEEQPALLSFALVFIVAGIGFKLAAVPFHMWAPDVYTGAPSSVTLLISSAPKIAALGMALRLLTLGLSPVLEQSQQLILVMALLSTIFGNLLAVSQTNLKRLFAYSAIAHSGYALFGILAGTPAGYGAALYYILVYALMSTAAFGLISMMSKEGAEVENIEDLKGLNRRNPWIAFMFLIVMFSMAGVPPAVGFFIKFAVLKALVDAGMLTVAVIGLLFAVIGAYYYIKIVKVMYFDEDKSQLTLKLPRTYQVVYSFNCLSLLYLGLFPAGLLGLCMNAFA